MPRFTSDARGRVLRYRRPVSTRAEWQALRERLAETDPDLVAAIDDVDRTLPESRLRMDPWERVERCFDVAKG